MVAARQHLKYRAVRGAADAQRGASVVTCPPKLYTKLTNCYYQRLINLIINSASDSAYGKLETRYYLFFAVRLRVNFLNDSSLFNNCVIS